MFWKVLSHELKRRNNVYLLLHSEVLGPPFPREQKLNIVRDGSGGKQVALASQSLQAPQKNTFGVLGINALHPGLLLSFLCK